MPGGAKIRKIGKPQFFYIKVGFKGVFIAGACFPDEKYQNLILQREVESIIATLQRLISEGYLEKSRLHQALQQHDGIPLELLWLLDKGGIISIGTYLGK